MLQVLCQFYGLNRSRYDSKRYSGMGETTIPEYLLIMIRTVWQRTFLMTV